MPSTVETNPGDSMVGPLVRGSSLRVHDAIKVDQESGKTDLLWVIDCFFGYSKETNVLHE